MRIGSMRKNICTWSIGVASTSFFSVEISVHISFREAIVSEKRDGFLCAQPFQITDKAAKSEQLFKDDARIRMAQNRTEAILGLNAALTWVVG